MTATDHYRAVPPAIEVDTSDHSVSRPFRVPCLQGLRRGDQSGDQRRQRGHGGAHRSGQGPTIEGGCAFGSWSLPTVFNIPDDIELAMVFSNYATKCLRAADKFKHKMYPDVDGVTFLHMGGPDHRRYRLLLGEVFSPGARRQWNDAVVASVVDRLIAKLLDREVNNADLLTELCDTLPAYVFGAIMDVHAEDYEKLKAWAYYIIAAPMDPRSAQQTAALGVYLGGLVAQRRVLSAEELAERTDSISVMIGSRNSEFTPIEEEIVSALFIPTAAGSETIGSRVSSTLFYLMSDPEVFGEVRSDRSLVIPAQEAALRLAPSGGCLERCLAVSDAVLGGEPIAQGTGVITNLYTANREAVRWERPDGYDLHRKRGADRGVRLRTAYVPGDAPGLRRNFGGSERAAGPFAGTAVRPRRAHAKNVGHAVPSPARSPRRWGLIRER